MKTVVVANQKGGVGKSTLAAHLAYAGSAAKKRVLLVDMDRQGSVSLTFPPTEGEAPGLQASQLYAAEVANTQPEVIGKYLSIIRADKALLDIDKMGTDALTRPAKALKRFNDEFDLCIIDTPPLLGNRLVASLIAGNFVVTPVSIGLYEQAGVADLMQTIASVRTPQMNPSLKFMGILPMKINLRSSLERDDLAELRRLHGPLIFQETISERAAVRKAVVNRQPVWEAVRGEGHQRAAQEWRAACKAILKKALQ